MLDPRDTGNGIYVGQMRSEYLVSYQHEYPERVKSLLDDALGEKFVESLKKGVESVIDKTDESIWFIRELEVSCSLNIALERDACTELIAGETFKELLLALRQSESDEVVHFPNKTSFLKSFIVSLLKSDAWEKWYYQSLEGLKYVPVSQAVRSVLNQKDTDTWAVLAELKQSEFSLLLNQFSSLDIRRLLLEYKADTSAIIGIEILQGQFLSHLTKLLKADWVANPDRVERDGLSFLRSMSQKGIIPDAESIKIVRALFTYFALLGDANSKLRSKYRKHIVSSNLSLLIKDIGAKLVDDLAPIVHLPSEFIQQLTDLFERPSNAKSEESGQQYQSPFGGLVRLLPVLDEINFKEICKDWQELDGVSAEIVLRHLVLSSCLGSEKRSRVYVDSLLSYLQGFEPHSNLGDAQDWLSNQITTLGVTGILKTAKESNTVPFGESQIVIELSKKHSYEFDREKNYGRWCGIRMTRSEDLGKDSGDEFRDENTHLADLEFLLKGPLFERQKILDAEKIVASLAQWTMRRFAQGLTGFANSSLEYLAENFLSCQAKLSQEEDRILVEMDSVSLQFILNMIGRARGSFELSWLTDSRLEIYTL